MSIYGIILHSHEVRIVIEKYRYSASVKSYQYLNLDIFENI